MEPRTKATEITGVSLGICASLGWATCGIATKLGRTQGFSPADLAILRYVVPLVLIPVLLFGAARLRGQITLPRALVLALCVGPVFALINNTAFGMAPLAHGVVIGPGTTLIVANLLLRVIDGQRIPPTRLVGFAILILGIVIMSSDAASAPGAFWQILVADALLILTGVMWGSFTYLVARWRIPAVPVIASVAVLGTAGFLPVYIGLLGPTPGLDPSLWSWQILFQGVIGGMLAPLMFAVAAPRIGASRAAIFPASVPPVAVLLSVPLTGEIPGVLTILGILIATLGIAASLGLLRLNFRRNDQ